MAGLVINTNMLSLTAQRNLRKAQSPLETAMQRLSSGLRINSAKDDSAGLAIATRMTSQIRGLTVAVRNANDGLSIAQTAEGAMDEMINNLQRIRELAAQAMSGQYSASDVGYMQNEVNALTEEIGRNADQTKFNNVSLFDGNFLIKLHVSYNASAAPISISIGNLHTTSTQMGGATFGVTATSTLSQSAVASESAVLADLRTDSRNPNDTRSLSAVTLNDGTTVQADSDGLLSGKYSLLRVGLVTTVDSTTNQTTQVNKLVSNASNTIAIVDKAMSYIISQKSVMGAKANQYEAAVRNIENVIETTTASKSRIMDADFAAETANMTKALIIQQAGISVLAQANTVPQNVLALIR